MTHLRMFRVGLARGDLREMWGQALRVLATIPGYLTGWVPRGNTGGANVSALKPMPLPADLEPLLRDSSVWRDVAWRGVIVALLALTGFATLALIEHRRANAAALLDTSDEIHEFAARQWGDRYRRVVAGEALCISGIRNQPPRHGTCRAEPPSPTQAPADAS